MSSFSADWLASREPADRAARDRGLMTAAGAVLDARDRPVRIVDLGCGTGSNLRALSEHCPERQDWCLIDHDPELLAEARARLSDWADDAEGDADTLRLAKGGLRLTVTFRRLDLSRELDAALDPTPDLVTASALFDLVSPEAIRGFAAAVAARCAVFHTSLTYDGREEWLPLHPADAQIEAAFHAHQAGEKGFGAAAGPRAASCLETAFRDVGYEVRRAASPWRLGAGEGDLIRRLAAGKAGAVAETGLLAPETVEAWRHARSEDGVSAVIGHIDILAWPPRR